ncbi:hypothetical protein HPP92_006647 [Vanilla planifolia]|uniref:Uncharacterized protein n=1 Tax=Vanilla planifolia TaxID=51239 RepID=A0A835R8Q1_VANPL|nr:hypothetical protein HPP92_006647 [Vanilla planifolia]
MEPKNKHSTYGFELNGSQMWDQCSMLRLGRKQAPFLPLRFQRPTPTKADGMLVHFETTITQQE